MKIIVDYESSWRNSFLDGSNNEPLPKKGNKVVGRNFVGSMTSLRKAENFIKREVTLDTVMGILNRIIGDQRKLYQARECDNYFFKDIDYVDSDKVIFKDMAIETNEMTYIRNITGSTDQQSFTGAIKTHDPMFSSDYSAEFWGVLSLDLESLCKFIFNDTKVKGSLNLAPEILVDKIEVLDKFKNVEKIDLVSDVVEKLNNKFPELVTNKVPTPYIEKDGKVKPMRLYAAALYLQHERLKKYFDMSTAISSRGSISGFSKRGFNGRRDFMNRFTTGKPKKIWGNPYAIKEFKSLKPIMTKASGKLEIEIHIDEDKAIKIEHMIERAGVSSFYLGKKGLAYISKIDPRPRRN